MTQSLWRIPDVTNIKTPLSILREQAQQLSQQTNSALQGFANVQPASSNNSVVSLFIQVPALNNYTFQLLVYYQPMTLYPGKMASTLQNIGPFDIVNEDSFIDSLQRILSSDQTVKIVESLWAQALSR